MVSSVSGLQFNNTRDIMQFWIFQLRILLLLGIQLRKIALKEDNFLSVVLFVNIQLYIETNRTA